jgi:hypothetical protein
MFGLFKRTKIEDWERQLLRNALTKLSSEYLSLVAQIDEGLLKGVLLDASDIQGYVAFTYHSSVLKKYDRKNEQDFRLTNINVYDRKSLSYIPYEIYVSSGTISGYALGGNTKSDIDVCQVNVSVFRKEFVGVTDYDRIENIFSEEERRLLNPSEVYSVFIGNKEYFHLEDLDDGDFIGIDGEKNVYKITHDPIKAVRLDKKIADILIK